MFFIDIYYIILIFNIFFNIKKLNLCMGEGRVYFFFSIFILKLSFFNVFFFIIFDGNVEIKNYLYLFF